MKLKNGRWKKRRFRKRGKGSSYAFRASENNEVETCSFFQTLSKHIKGPTTSRNANKRKSGAFISSDEDEFVTVRKKWLTEEDVVNESSGVE